MVIITVTLFFSEGDVNESQFPLDTSQRLLKMIRVTLVCCIYHHMNAIKRFPLIHKNDTQNRNKQGEREKGSRDDNWKPFFLSSGFSYSCYTTDSHEGLRCAYDSRRFPETEVKYI